MRKVCLCTMLAALALSGQSINQPFDQVNPPSDATRLTQALARVHLALTAMMQPGVSADLASQQLADSMAALALPERKPTRPELTAFTDELAKAFNGKIFDHTQGATLVQCIADLLRAEDVSNYQIAERLRETLSAAGISDGSADLVIRRFLVIGEAVRGPDDEGVRKAPSSKR
jgi:hypothetical protein